MAHPAMHEAEWNGDKKYWNEFLCADPSRPVSVFDGSIRSHQEPIDSLSSECPSLPHHHGSSILGFESAAHDETDSSDTISFQCEGSVRDAAAEGMDSFLASILSQSPEDHRGLPHAVTNGNRGLAYDLDKVIKCDLLVVFSSQADA